MDGWDGGEGRNGGVGGWMGRQMDRWVGSGLRWIDSEAVREESSQALNAQLRNRSFSDAVGTIAGP